MYNVYEKTLVEAQSMATSITTPTFYCARMFNYGFEFIWSNGTSPIGSTYLEVSDDGINWSKYQDTELLVSGNNDNNIVDVREVAHTYVRGVYARSSGSGTLKVIVNSKGW